MLMWPDFIPDTIFNGLHLSTLRRKGIRSTLSDVENKISYFYQCVSNTIIRLLREFYCDLPFAIQIGFSVLVIFKHSFVSVHTLKPIMANNPLEAGDVGVLSSVWRNIRTAISVHLSEVDECIHQWWMTRLNVSNVLLYVQC